MGIIGGNPDYIKMYILIIISTLYTGNGYTNNAISFQEFNSMNQCQYAANIIKSRAATPYRLDTFCLNK